MERGSIEFSQLKGKAKLRAEAKLLIIASWKQFLAPYIAKGQKVRGEEIFAEEYNSHQLSFDSEIYKQIPKIYTNYPRRWLRKLEEKGAGALAGEYKNEKTHLIDEEEMLKQFCLDVATRARHKRHELT